ncbi:MAG: HAMP domain-containing protein [Saprospiraceae bacterium]|nr:HAMP domain-containing protein [Saprospiraceae bacterium]
MRKFNITDRLILASLSLSVVTIFIVASYSFYNAKEAILERTFNQLTSVRVVKTNLVEKFFSNSINEVQLAKSSADVKKIAQQINQIKNSANFRVLTDSLVNFRNPFINEISKNYYTKISIVGNNKLIYHIKTTESQQIKSNQDYDSLWNSTISSENAVVRDLTKTDNSSQPFITISSKISDLSNNTIGIIVFEISLNSINSIMLEVNPENGLGTSGESYLVGQDFLMRSSSRFHANSVLNTLVKTEAVDSAFSNLPGTKIIKDYRGISVLSSYSKINIPNLDWIILTEIDYREATIPIYRIRNEILFISIFIFFIVLIVVFILSKKITYPIKRLTSAAHEVGSGNLDVEIKNTSKDEIGDLIDTFNNMIQKLKVQTEELEISRIKGLRSLIDGQESERQRLSRELHDSLGQLLIGLKLKYESCLNQDKDAKATKDNFVELGLLFDRTIDETRRISNNLMPAALSEFGLTTAIRNLCNEISETAKINIQFNAEGIKKNLDIIIKTYLYRITQEALTNIIKHSEAKNATILIKIEDDVIKLEINDDGQGFDKSKIKINTNGLNNIKDRIALLSGSFTINSEISKGTTLYIEVPLEGMGK